ncbi:CinA family protein [Auraticoccus monumenti]|uniref:Nicotinamide-nucleotide amidase n=1 Tax=Auraticoccus monumenti TaxID=675864 RepID=A0A1G7CMR8_9ACTN|nr:CinA family protein [Auraticoccus monumenti]SDE40533.1 nicotinamide-nucleotide amidase [Auraticoccus monumenti]
MSDAERHVPPDAQELVEALVEADADVATAESLTAGLVAATLAEVPGSSEVLLGGVVTYAVAAKHEVLGVPQDLLDAYGAISEECVRAMAEGARERFRADVGLATTGVAGPAGSEGHPPGYVWIAVSEGGDVHTELLHLVGDRQQVRNDTVRHVMALAVRALRDRVR